MTVMKRLLLASACCLVLGCHSPAEKTQAYLTKGIGYYNKGDYTKARIELRNVLQIDNKKADAFYYLALIDEKEQNWSSMFANLSQSVVINPKNNNARLKLGQMLLLSTSDGLNKATEQVEAILKNTPNDPGALTLKASILFRQDKVEQAILLLEDILKQHPDFLDALSLKTYVYLAKNDFATALAIVDKSLAIHPDDQSLRLLKLQIHTDAKNVTAIEQDYAELMKRFPEKLDFNYAFAKYYSDSGQADKAVKILQDTINNNATQLMPKLVFVDYLVSKNPKLVESTLKTYLTQHANESELLFRLANFYLQEKKYPQAKEQLKLVIAHTKESKEALPAKMLLAQILLAEGQDPKHEEVSALIKEILAVDPLYLNALLMKAKITIEAGLYDQAIADLRSILNNYPKSDDAMVLLAQVYFKQNSPELAEESLRKALAINPNNLDALIPIATKLMQNKEVGRATELVEKGLAGSPNNLQLLQFLAQIKLYRDDWAGVQKIADTLIRQPKAEGFSKYLTGKILQGQKKYQEAIAKYKEVLLITPGSLDALKGLVECYESLNQHAEIFTFLDGHIKANPENPDFLLLKAQFLAFDKRFNDAIKVLADALVKWPKIPQFYVQMAKLYTLPQDSDKVIAIYNKALTNIPGNVDLNMDLAAIYEQKGDYANAAKIYEALMATQADNEALINNFASLLLDRYPTKENIDRAVKLVARFAKSEEPYFLDTYAWSLLNSGHYDEALQVSQTVVAKLPDVAVFRYHLGVAYHKTKNDSSAVTELEQALALGEKSGNFSEKKVAADLLNEIKAAKK